MLILTFCLRATVRYMGDYCTWEREVRSQYLKTDEPWNGDFCFVLHSHFCLKGCHFPQQLSHKNKRRLSQFVVSTAAQFDFFDKMILEVKNKCCLLNVISKRHLIKHIQGSAERFHSEPLHVTISTINPIHRVIKNPAVVKKLQIS